MEELAGGGCGLRGHKDPGMKKVLAEIDQETDVIDGLWRHARETKYGAHQPFGGCCGGSLRESQRRS